MGGTDPAYGGVAAETALDEVTRATTTADTTPVEVVWVRGGGGGVDVVAAAEGEG